MTQCVASDAWAEVVNTVLASNIDHIRLQSRVTTDRCCFREKRKLDGVEQLRYQNRRSRHVPESATFSFSR